MDHSRITLVVSALLVFTTLSSCESSVYNHPHEDRIPKYGVNSVDKISKNRNKNGYTYEYLNILNKKSTDTVSTGILVEEPKNIEVSRIDSNKIVVLDKSNYNLYLYNRKTNNYKVVSSNGNSPGNVASATGLYTIDDTAYVGTRDFRIVTYTCLSTCSYDSTRRVNFSVRDISVNNNLIFSIGFAASNQIDRDPLDRIVQVIEGDEVINSFGSKYNTNFGLASYELNTAYIESTIKPKSILAFKNFPYLYVFNDDKILNLYKFKDFYMPYYREGKDRNFFSIDLAETSSNITRVKKVGPSRIVITITTTYWGGKPSTVDQPSEVESEYYTLNTGSGNIVYDGKYEGKTFSDTRIIPTLGKPVIVNNGEMFVFK